MKKTLAVILILVIIIFNATAAYCETPAFRKFRRGFCNLLTFHLEFVHQMEKESAIGGTNRAVTIGLINGIGMTAVRILTGAYEVVTFPIPLPAGYKPILTDPEFYWTEPFSEGGAAK